MSIDQRIGVYDPQRQLMKLLHEMNTDLRKEILTAEKRVLRFRQRRVRRLKVKVVRFKLPNEINDVITRKMNVPKRILCYLSAIKIELFGRSAARYSVCILCASKILIIIMNM
jgi:hypothetical protein